MKPHFLCSFFIMLAVEHIVAQTATLNGHIDHPKGKNVYLRHYSDYITYAEATIDSGVINKKGDFKMTFDWPEPGPVTFYHGDEITELYLCPGDNLHLYLDTKEFDETLVYKGFGADRNTYCAQKMLESSATDPSIYKLPVEVFYTYVDSVRDVNYKRIEVITASSGLLNSCLTDFLNFEYAEIEYEWAYNKLTYPMMYRYYNQRNPGFQAPEPDYSFLQQVKIENQDALGSTWYVSFLEEYIQVEVNKLMREDTSKEALVLKEKYIVENFTDDVLDYAYANMIYEQLTFFNDTASSCPILRRYKEAFPNGKYIVILDSVVTTISKLGTGNKAPDFTASDAEGNNFSLHDFKGKYVYLDIWATWCGPCVGEIPAMEKLIDMFEGEEVVFLSVSVDDDQERWKKFVTDKHMQGVQLHSPGGFESSISKQYAVVGIPRYILIDKEGVIIEGNADRPGDMRDKLNSLLDK